MPTFRPPAGVSAATVSLRRSLVGALVVAMAMTTSTGLAPRPAAADFSVGAAVPGPTPIGATVTFYGRGYGHGVGMSQYGARGRALDGQLAGEILTHYYPGTTQGSVPLTSQVRVRVLRDYRPSATRPLILYARRTAWRFDGMSSVFPADARVDVRPIITPTATGSVVTWRVRVFGPTGELLRDAITRSFRMRGVSSGSAIEVVSKASVYDTYRGVVRVLLSPTAPRANVVNELPLEWYLRGVVPAEMPATWPAEALKAQAIAARSYAARRLRPGISWFDIGDDASSQVYRGTRGERVASTAAVIATAGAVLRSGSAIANALFHSTAGGATEDNENVFNAPSGALVAGPVPYLRGSADRRPDGSSYDAAAPYATWRTATYSRDQLSAWFGADPRTAVGTITALDLTHRGVSGRLISVTLIGSAGTKTVSGNLFRAVFEAGRPVGDPMLRSTLFDTAPIP